MHAAGAEAVSPSAFSTTVAAPTENLTYAAMNYGPSMGVSSSSADAVDAERDSLATLDAGQPPARRRTYGRPRYSDKMHNSDGSSKIAFEVGGGMAVPSGPTGRYYTPSYKFSVGGGLNWSKAFGVLIQFDYDHFGLTGGNINQMFSKYSSLPGYTSSDFAGLDANSHIWSFSVNPTINFQGSGRGGAYVVGGVGYGRKVTNFTLPSSGTYCDYYGFCYQYQSNQTFDDYKSGGLLVSGGFGLTYKMSNFSSQRLFAEARYQWLNAKDNQSYFYPYNNRNTGYFPVTVGLRW